MKLSVMAMERGITRVSLSGPLDDQSAIEIEMSSPKSPKKNKNLLVDLSDVTSIASLSWHRHFGRRSESNGQQWQQNGFPKSPAKR